MDIRELDFKKCNCEENSGNVEDIQDTLRENWINYKELCKDYGQEEVFNSALYMGDETLTNIINDLELSELCRGISKYNVLYLGAMIADLKGLNKELEEVLKKNITPESFEVVKDVEIVEYFLRVLSRYGDLEKFYVILKNIALAHGTTEICKYFIKSKKDMDYIVRMHKEGATYTFFNSYENLQSIAFYLQGNRIDRVIKLGIDNCVDKMERYIFIDEVCKVCEIEDISIKESLHEKYDCIL